MRTLTPTHPGSPPPLAEPAAEEPRSRVGRRLTEIADQAIRLPSEQFCGAETITVAEWRRRHALTYGDRGSADLTVFVSLLTLLLAGLLVAFLGGALDHQIGEVLR